MSIVVRHDRHELRDWSNFNKTYNLEYNGNNVSKTKSKVKLIP